MLNVCSGDGQIIKNNFNSLNIQGTMPEFSTLAFKVEFQEQHGTLIIQLKSDTIDNITLDLNRLFFDFHIYSFTSFFHRLI
ncbi:hypothetical protein BKK39_09225 [Bacillus cereus]|uniref:hypothetical protein n=1 Tax=Bacillus cereus group TaxID=86661 RepID=UPI000978AC6D|nr:MULTISPECIES: hypothetical protein [unclassified Bacillus cereus group]MDX5868492.1 hypothetical protein [Bacillus cereus group sp. BfR-BA-01119]MDX5911124.1 hypothetical protein [Bacillus cereus group sp. BfR-BA-01029]ONG98986.1 hypothetical protein BKK39_09225 [Bacillus cereus]